MVVSPRLSEKPGYSLPKYWEFEEFAEAPVGGPIRGVTDLAEWVRQIANMIVNMLNNGVTNAKGQVTLDASTTTTSLTDKSGRLGSGSKLVFTPLTENARAEGVPAVTSKGQDTATLTHTNTADTDKTYDYVVFN